MPNLFISPHNDDETLFGAFTLCREAADIQVVVIFDGHVQASRGEPVTYLERRLETREALLELGVDKPPIFAGFRDDLPDWGGVRDFLNDLIVPSVIYAPLPERNGHSQHNAVGNMAKELWVGARPRLTYYTTYTSAGKSVSADQVIPTADHVIRKLRALACYKSQITVDNCREHFMRGLHEYYA